MKTFIGLTFAFLAFAFYEMSGGSEFEPASARIEAQAPVATAEAAPAPKIGITRTAAVAPEPQVTRVALNLTNLQDATEAATAPDASKITATPGNNDVQITPVALDQGDANATEESPQIILPSLIATTPEAPRGDIREVSGNRVNVRGGPSTDYGVVGKLTRGDAVRVLEDNGNGWVLMEAVNGGTEGWMAEFLLTSG
ncbi:SH3 domain-containing protein [Sulfitobacter albidus]|uniref:SH3 domain-containing protein n=1 Tax=Sulfitobacter albidus TaxID=2829501 RepID=A0A975JC28_9RHOB|nr:SH3 domain-containing protein [Sulfitobacter albidus]QUJ75729.1 SH3 domain-containing protein [Sulfitobacter albidus]